MFILNRSDNYSLQVINSISNKIDRRKSALKYSISSSDNLSNKKQKEINTSLKILDDVKKKEIENFINKNNLEKYYEIKFLFRNFFMALIWAFAFFKLSRI